MTCIYGEVGDIAVKDNLTDLINQTFKLLPYKQYENPCFTSHITTLLSRIRGMSELFPTDPVWITILSTLQAAKSEEDFYVFRKHVLDACSTLSTFQRAIGDSIA